MVTDRVCTFCGQRSRCSGPFDPAVAPQASAICAPCARHALVELTAAEEFDSGPPTDPQAPSPIRRLTPPYGGTKIK